MKQVGIVGWRGMVGSVLLQRMIEENDFDDISAHFFSTSSAGGVGPVINGKSDILKDANSLSALAEMDIIITCQGGDYTKAIYPALINHGWLTVGDQLLWGAAEPLRRMLNILLGKI